MDGGSPYRRATLPAVGDDSVGMIGRFIRAWSELTSQHGPTGAWPPGERQRLRAGLTTLSDQGQDAQCSRSRAITGPGRASRRYCAYFATSAWRAAASSSEASTTRPTPSTRTHHSADQSSS